MFLPHPFSSVLSAQSSLKSHLLSPAMQTLSSVQKNSSSLQDVGGGLVDGPGVVPSSEGKLSPFLYLYKTTQKLVTLKRIVHL